MNFGFTTWSEVARLYRQGTREGKFMSYGFRAVVLVVSCLLPFATSLAQGPILKDPIFIRIENGWMGLFAHDYEYAEYSLKGSNVELQDPYHALLEPKVGAMVSFADKKEFGEKPDLLTAHREWELAYWRKHSARMESKARDDIRGSRIDLMITEMRLFNNEGSELTMYCVALASKQGVFVVSISGPSEATSNLDPRVKEIADSVKLVRRPLDAEEVKRITLEMRAKQKAITRAP